MHETQKMIKNEKNFKKKKEKKKKKKEKYNSLEEIVLLLHLFINISFFPKSESI